MQYDLLKTNTLGYDDTKPESIEAFAKQLIGKTFQEVFDNDVGVLKERTASYDAKHGDFKRKGGLGELIEECFFHYKANNDAQPDFPKAGVELKVTPYRENRDKSLAAKERLIITMIDYFNVVNETFESSHLWSKARLILLIYYLYKNDLMSRMDYQINFVKLFTPPENDKKIIEQDFNKIQEKIKAGKAHELSEGDTMYLGAAPKAATSANRRKQPFSSELAKPRAFAFKNSYMTYVLNTYIVPNKNTYEPIIKLKEEQPFEEYVAKKIGEYKGWKVEDLCKKFSVDCSKKPKNLEAMLAYRILGLKGNHAEEFEKANIKVKTIRIENNGKIKENMSFPTFKFKDIVEESWESSTFGNYLRETRFFFVVYKFDEKGTLRLLGCQFWNIPYQDLECEVRKVWEKTVQVLKNGLKITEKNGKKYNNFPKASENRVSHVRPHAINANDTYDLPDGRKYPKQCFWLNNTYVLSQLKMELFGTK